jgi:hypothetical protein
LSSSAAYAYNCNNLAINAQLLQNLGDDTPYGGVLAARTGEESRS